METRKVQLVGGGTYTISLPIDWADGQDLEAGELLYLYSHTDGSLVVRRNEKNQNELTTVEVVVPDSDGSTIEQLLTAAYSAGFERITLDAESTFTAEQRRAINTLSREFTGLEIAEESDSQITVRVLLNASEVSVRQSVIQLRFIALSMHEAAIAALVGNEAELDYIPQRDDEADRVFRLIARHFNRSLMTFAELDQLGLTRREVFAYYLTARQLERVADHAVRIARITKQYDDGMDETLRREISSLGADARELVERATNAVINDVSQLQIHAVLDLCDDVLADAAVIEETLDGEQTLEAFVVIRALDSVVRTVRLGKNIAECALQNRLY